MKLFILIAPLLITTTLLSQKHPYNLKKTYSVNQALKDIDYTEKYLTKFHPDPFKYISKDSLHDFVLKQKAKIDTSLTEMQLRFYVKSIVAKIGCGHTDVGASKKYTKTILKTSRAILPLNTVVLDSNKLYIINNLSVDTTIKNGDEILGINEQSTNKILQKIYSIYSTDGFNETSKKLGISYKWFKYYYSFCYGLKKEYLVKIKHQNNTIKTYTLNAISSLKDTLILPKKDSINYIQKTKKCSYSISADIKNLAVIDIDGFSGWRWHHFLRKSFKNIRKKNISNLVIDLRDNGGGQIGYGMNLLSYMIHKPTYLSYDRKPNVLPLNFRFKMGIFTRVAPILFLLRFQNFPKNGRLRHYIFNFHKYRNAYHGNIFVLINGKSFSMSSVTSTYLKYKANATIIGEETGGNIAGSNAVINGKIILPNSKIRIFIPIYHVYHTIDVKNNGHGLRPDYPTNYTIDDILNATDVDMNKVLEIIKKTIIN